MAKTKYRKWLENILDVKGWSDVTVDDLINDPTYDYKIFYDTYPQEAKAMLNKNADAHFNDIGKTVYHPTFSDESYYSGRRTIKNPKGIIGGHWSELPFGKSRYTLSKSQINNNWNIKDTIDYLSIAENNGAEIRLPNGKLPVIDGIRFDGVLPNIEIIKNRRNLQD